jgi:hypothetical protein
MTPYALVALLPALATAQSRDPPLASPPGEVSPLWWVILGVLAVVLIWAVIRAQRRGGAAGGP